LTNGMKGPGLFLAQFVRDEPPFDSLDGLAQWVARLGYKGVQVPTWDARMIDIEAAAASRGYCEDYQGGLRALGLEVTELAAPIQGQVLAMHPAYEIAFQGFYPEGLSDDRRGAWATEQLLKVIRATANMGLNTIPALTGGFAWHMAYPWPQRPEGLIEEAFRELARRWKPLLDAAHERGLTFAFEPHPGSDVFDGATWEMFVAAVGEHPAACLNYDPSHFVLQQLDYLAFIRLYGDRIRGFHVKDAEFRPDGRVGTYGGYQSWSGRAGRFRSLGDGQVDFRRVFTLLTEAGFDGWAILEWECCVKSQEQGAAEGAPFIAAHLIQPTTVAFDDFAGSASDAARNRRILGLQ
jgi:sugar phosphate isomerase/epimerase